MEQVNFRNLGSISMRCVVFLAMLALATAHMAQAGELRYAPINPSFGGSSFNSSHLLGTAESQNDNEKPREQTDPLENFSRTITSSLLNRIAFQISEQIFGENAQNSGQFLLGDTVIDFERVGDTVVVGITDGLTGNQTTIEVPAPVL